ncbi:MAG: glycosyltransferase family 4 protein [Chitinophagaceae bacterium]|nr:glycosyltransferase family 4 protein [Chitinophagaceae bacterium]
MDKQAQTIWIINQFAGTHTSGWGERHFYFSQYWIKRGCRVQIISGSYNHMFNELPKTTGHFTQEVVEGIPFCWVKTPVYNPKSMMRFWSFLVFAFKILFLPVRQLGKPDIIVVSSMPIFPILTGYWLKRKYKASKLIFEIRDIWPLTLILLGNKSPNHPAVRFIGWFEKFGYKKADLIVSLLPNAREHFEEIAGCGHKFRYIPNGLESKVLQSEPLDAKITDVIPENRFIIGYTGTIGLANALEFFVEAAGLLKKDTRFHFVIVGEGYLKQELMDKSKDFGNITFISKIRKNQVQTMIQYFDICFVGRNDTPLFKHGVSANKYFDYMLAGKPVLDSNNKIKDPIELSGGGIIVQPDSAQAIVQGILDLFQMTKTERAEMGQRGKQYIEQHHSIEHLAMEYFKLFKA